jgi:hypothetical protein
MTDFPWNIQYFTHKSKYQCTINFCTIQCTETEHTVCCCRVGSPDTNKSTSCSNYSSQQRTAHSIPYVTFSINKHCYMQPITVSHGVTTLMFLNSHQLHAHKTASHITNYSIQIWSKDSQVKTQWVLWIFILFKVTRWQHVSASITRSQVNNRTWGS